MFEVSFMEKPALAMDIEDFVKALNAEKILNQEIEQALLEKNIFGDVTTNVARQLKAETFSSTGSLTVKGIGDIFKDLKKAGLSRHATIKAYMANAVQYIRSARVTQ